MAEVEEEHHVKFNEDQNIVGKQNQIAINEVSPSYLQVHLGFLQLNHTYEILVPLIKSKHTNNMELMVDECSASTYCSVKHCENLVDQVNILILMKANKPKLMNEKVKLSYITDPNKQLEISLLARVLGKGQGTPMLKDGIHCVGVEQDEESEVSDWQGFE